MANPKYNLPSADAKRAEEAFRKAGEAMLMTAEQAQENLVKALKMLAESNRRSQV